MHIVSDLSDNTLLAPVQRMVGPELEERYVQNLQNNIEDIYATLELDEMPVIDPPPAMLSSPHRICIFCPQRHVLHKYGTVNRVTYINSNYKKCQAWLMVAQCRRCKANYYPDRISRCCAGGRSRYDFLECDATVLQISREPALWVAREVGFMQQALVYYNHMSWTGFMNYFNEVHGNGDAFSFENSRRLFVEHFIRRLIRAYEVEHAYRPSKEADATTKVRAFLELLGPRSKLVPLARRHACGKCTHARKPGNQAPNLNVPINAVAEVNDEVNDHSLALSFTDSTCQIPVDEAAPEVGGHDQEVIDQLGQIQEEENENEMEVDGQLVRMAVIDGKTLTHRVCGFIIASLYRIR
jgi:hypothetical protein